MENNDNIQEGVTTEESSTKVQNDTMNNNDENKSTPDGNEPKKEKNKKEKIGEIIVQVLGLAMMIGIVVGIVALIDWGIDCFKHETDRHISENVELRENVKSGKKYIYNTAKHRRTVRNIRIVQYSDGDEQLLYASNKKDLYGYLDPQTGAMVIPFMFDDANSFIDGLALVSKDGQSYYIDSTGANAFGGRTFCNLEYSFTNSYAFAYVDENHAGIIDRQGQWVIEPVYSDISSFRNGYRTLERNDSIMLVDSMLNIILPLQEGRDISVTDNGIITKTYRNRPGEMYDLEGKRIPGAVYNEVAKLEYINEEGNTVTCPHNLMYYFNNGHDDYEGELYGLMTSDGRPLTEAIYSDIEALNATLFKCYLDYGNVVLLDRYGKPVE